MKTSIFALLPPALLLGCQGQGFDPYYTGTPPTISGLDLEKSTGTVGGETVTISGSDFGEDPDQITVVFGARNAEILSATDSALVVKVPRGPLQGGKVPVSVGTMGGQATLDDGFKYSNGFETSDELAYLVVGNNYMSCLGGLGRGDAISGCETFAYTGLGGIDGRAEFLKYAYPNLHDIYMPGAVGYGTTGDWSWEEWSIQTPSLEFIPIDIENEFEDERIQVKSFSLKNPELDGETWRANLRSQASWVYQGGLVDGAWMPSAVVQGEGGIVEQGGKNDSATRTYDMSEIQFCETHEFDTPRSFTYAADWPVGDYFFVGSNGRPGKKADVLLDVPDVGISDVGLTLPPYAYFYSTDGTSYAGDPDISSDWGAFGLDTSCPDTDGDGVTTLADNGLRWEWEPFDGKLADGKGIKGARTFIRLTVNNLALGWYGGYGQPFRASISVPDDYNYDEETGLSSIEVPAWVLYQVPTSSLSFGEQVSPLGGPDSMIWGDPADPSYGYLVVTLERITEYRVEAEVDGRNGELVFAYSTGDFGFFEFNHPLKNDGCGNCIDDDGDGWTDYDDPDCRGAGTEEDNSTFGDTTCNDGKDNDNDGLTDADDPECTSGVSGETNCGDGKDNDDDGFIDEEDGECLEEDGVEAGDDDPTWGCFNGLDDDLDGWIDLDDPDCGNATDVEVGLGTTECNDGIDNDGHGDIDALDLNCAIYEGAEGDEQPAFTLNCADGLDNDEDGYIDANDPDCELKPNAYENKDFFTDSNSPVITACYNGVDDDHDGYTDGTDPGCVNEAGEPDGFVDDEDASNPGVLVGCFDLVDNDDDGWIDELDPDCVSSTEEDDSAYGTTTCNDGLDNDEDTFVDADDEDCLTGLSDAEVAP